MNRRWINTKVEFIWDGSQYVEQYSEGYWYDGEMALAETWNEHLIANNSYFILVLGLQLTQHILSTMMVIVECIALMVLTII